MSVNWLIVLLILLAWALARLAVTGRYQQVWLALSNIPLTPAQAQQQAQVMQAVTQPGFNRIG
jgi:hypothetical protein